MLVTPLVRTSIFFLLQRVFIIVNYDVDSICTYSILKSLLKFKHVVYSVGVVQGVNDLKNAYQENFKDVKIFILINCGATLDLVDVLEPEEDIVFFVLDSHRPTDLCNIYSNGQIRLLWKPEEDGEVPEFHDVFREDEVS